MIPKKSQYQIIKEKLNHDLKQDISIKDNDYNCDIKYQNKRIAEYLNLNSARLITEKVKIRH